MQIKLGRLLFKIIRTNGKGYKIFTKRLFVHIWYGKTYVYFGILTQEDLLDE